MSPRRSLVSASEPTRRPSLEDTATAFDEKAGFSIVATRHKPQARWTVTSGGGAVSIMIVVAGAVREDAPSGSILHPRFTIAIRPATTAPHWMEASPSGAHTVTIELTARMLKAHPPSHQLLTAWHTFRGRSSVELAWRIAGELAGPDAMTPAALRVLVSGIVIGTSRYFLHKREATTTHPMAAAAQRILDRQFARPPSLSTLAGKVGCSTEHLARTFRTSFGFSVRDWIARRRVEAAKQLLTGTRREIGEVAQQLGFCDASHFARAFKRATSMTPAQFRASHAEIKPVLPRARPSDRKRAGGVRSLHD